MKKELRIAFMGTPDFAVASLKAIHEAGKNVVAVITAPDKKSGRGQKISQSAVKKYALQEGLLVLQPTNLKDPDFLKELKALEIDLQVVVAFRMLPESVWNMPPLGTFNLHASLLPKFRGAAPINWAIMQGEKETGISTFFLQHEIDTGDLLFQQKIAISEQETAESLHDKLMEAGSALVLKTLEAIENKSVNPRPQPELDESELHLMRAPKIFRPDCRINWNWSPEKIDRFVRGLSPYPAAWTEIVNRKTAERLNLKVYKLRVNTDIQNTSAVELKTEGKSLHVLSSSANFELLEVQLEGKKRMDIASLLNGFNFEDYEIH